MPSHRLFQVNELIRQELNSLFLAEVDFPVNCLATIVDVQTAKDLRHAKVWLSVMPVGYTKKVLDKLNRNAGHLQFLLKKKLNLKPIPSLHFAVDTTEAEAQGIENILNKIQQE